MDNGVLSMSFIKIPFTFCFSSLLCSTILEEEKAQQEERMRMEMRRQVTVSWDSGGSDDAPPKVRHMKKGVILKQQYCFTASLLAGFFFFL